MVGMLEKVWIVVGRFINNGVNRRGGRWMWVVGVGEDVGSDLVGVGGVVGKGMVVVV